MRLSSYKQRFSACRAGASLISRTGALRNQQAVGGRPPRYATLRPATEARSGSLEPGRPSRARSANTRHPAGRPHTPPADRMYATDARQTDVREHHRLMPPRRGHNKYRPYGGEKKPRSVRPIHKNTPRAGEAGAQYRHGPK